MQRISLAAACAVALVSSTAEAHISIANPNVPANATSKITFNISHGCGTSDTTAIQLDIPVATLTSLRPLYSDFGPPAVTKNSATPAQVTTVTWTKTEPALGADEAFYELTIRARVADAPFTQVPINVTQTCADGSVVHWDGTNPEEPAPLLTIVPPRSPGWNKYTLTTAIAFDDLGKYFKDAMIVWKGNAAFSPNINIAALIPTTTGVTALSEGLSVGDEIWVRY